MENLPFEEQDTCCGSDISARLLEELRQNSAFLQSGSWEAAFDGWKNAFAESDVSRTETWQSAQSDAEREACRTVWDDYCAKLLHEFEQHMREIHLPAGETAALAAALDVFQGEAAEQYAPGLYDAAAAHIAAKLPWSTAPVNSALQVWALLPESESRKDGVLAGLIESLAAELSQAPNGKGVPMSVLSAWERLDGETLERTSTSLILRGALDKYREALKAAEADNTQKNAPQTAPGGARSAAAKAPLPSAAPQEQISESEEKRRAFWMLDDFRNGAPMLPSMQRRLEALLQKSQTLMSGNGKFQEDFRNAQRQKIWECLDSKNDPDARNLGIDLCKSLPENETLERGGVARTVAQLRTMIEHEQQTLTGAAAPPAKVFLPGGQAPAPPISGNSFHKQKPPLFVQNQQQTQHKSARSGEKYTLKQFAIAVAIWCILPAAAVMVYLLAGSPPLENWVKGMCLLYGMYGVINIAVRRKWVKQGYRD
jgi:hypothetical protein